MRSRFWGTMLAVGFSATAAQASFHFMQIEQVIGGVNGDVTAQAVQLRLRSAGQSLVASSRINIRDAAGLNPVLLCDLNANVPNGAGGARVLIASPAFLKYTSPVAAPNFTMTNLIPASYLAAGSLTFEDDFGTVYWRLSWGGAAYTGTGAGSVSNDADGNFNPPFTGPCPSATLQALRFTGAANAPSTNNAANYAVTAGAAVFNNNAGTAFTVIGTANGACCFADTSCQIRTATNCGNIGGNYQGDGTSCSPNLCPPPPLEACCLESGFCDLLLAADCIAQGGTPQTNVFDCGEVSCPQPPTESCCRAFDGACFDFPVDLCLLEINGTPGGPGSFCQGDANSNGTDDECEAGVPAATVVTAVSRRSNPHAPGVCDTNLLPPRKSEPHGGGIQEVRIGFDVTPGAPSGSGITLESATCPTGVFSPDASPVSGSVVGNELVLLFSPGLANARTYRMTIDASVSSVAGQTVEVRGLVGDVDGSGFVNATDRSIVVGAWTGPGGFTCPTDVDSSGATNATDRSVVVGAWTGAQNCAP